MINHILHFLVAIAIGAVFSTVLLNMVLGCGEQFPRSDGSYEQGECFLIPMR